jgi:hypothetical protein
VNVYLYISEEYDSNFYNYEEPPEFGKDVAMIAAESRGKARYIGWKEYMKSYCDISELRASVKKVGTIDHAPGILTDEESGQYWEGT